MFTITALYVLARTDTLVTHSLDAIQYHHKPLYLTKSLRKTHAIHLLAALTLSAEMRTVLHHVLVCQHTSVHRHIVDQNAQLIQNVRVPMHAYGRNV